MIARRVRSPLVATVAVLSLLAGCGDDGGSEPQRSAAEAAVGFATDLLQHDAQAMVLLDVARERELPEDAAAVLGEVQLHRAAEVESLTQWLSEESAEIPPTVRDHVSAGHGDHGPRAADDETGADLPGMPDADALEQLDAATGEEFVRLLVELLVGLNEGAIEIADDYRADLDEGPVRDLADELGEQRTAETKQLERATPS